MFDRFGALAGVLILPVAVVAFFVAVGNRSERDGQREAGGIGADRIVLPIEYIYAGRSRDGGTIRAAVLSADFVCNLDQASVEALAPRVVGQLTSLLDDSSYVRHAATVLGCIGPQAAAAIPALERALAKEESAPRPLIVVQPDFQVDFALRSALAKIKSSPDR